MPVEDLRHVGSIVIGGISNGMDLLGLDGHGQASRTSRHSAPEAVAARAIRVRRPAPPPAAQPSLQRRIHNSIYSGSRNAEVQVMIN